jgi:Protein of unknown function (DUF3667)
MSGTRKALRPTALPSAGAVNALRGTMQVPVLRAERLTTGRAGTHNFGVPVTSDQKHRFRRTQNRCANCEARIVGSWCSQCGQKKTALDPTWHELVHESVHEFLHLDGKIFRTARKLLLEPGELTAEHIRGRRARYIGPLRLYLTMSVVFFLLSASIPNPDPNENPVTTGDAGAAPSHALPSAAVATPTGSSSRIANGLRRAAERPNYFDDMVVKTFPKMMFVLVPLFALLLKFFYRNPARRYPQFLYFSLHFHAAVFGFLSLTVPLQSFTSEVWLTTAQLIVLIGSMAYLMGALKRVFGGSSRQTVWRASALAVTYGTVMLAAIGTTILLSLYRLGEAP